MNNSSITVMHDHIVIILGTVLIIAVISSPSVTFAVPNQSNDSDTHCTPTGEKSDNGLELVKCCWFVKVKPGTGHWGADFEQYCSECENGGSRGKINCSEPELQYRTAPTTDESVFPNNEGVAEDPQVNQPSIRSDQSINLDDNILEQNSQTDIPTSVEESNSGITSFP